MSASDYRLDATHPTPEIEQAEKEYFRPVPCIKEIDYDSAYADITKRFPKIIARLAE